MRLRILGGTLALVIGLAGYALLVMRLAVAILTDNPLLAILFYSVTGTAWLWPAARLTRWMQDIPDPVGQ